MKIEEYQELKKKAQEVKRNLDRAEGAYNQVLEEIKEKLGVESEEEARELLTKLLQERDLLRSQRDKAYAHFQKKLEEVQCE